MFPYLTKKKKKTEVPKFATGGSLLPNNATSSMGSAAGIVSSPLDLITGSNFNASAAPIQSGTNAGQINTAYGQAQSGLAQQQAFVDALANQHGIGNQSSVFNQQQALAKQLQGVANGTGPNPAQMALNQATTGNIANQAALMAGQRGAGANAGLIARQAAMQGANTQQQAVGQGAQMQAQQQLAAMGQLSGQQANMANLATQQVGQQAGAITGYNTAAQNEQGKLLDANSAYNNQLVSMQGNMNNVNAQMAQGNQKARNDLMGGLMQGGGMMSMMGAKGGIVKNYAEGGMEGDINSSMPKETPGSEMGNELKPNDSGNVEAPAAGPQSFAGQYLSGASIAAPSIASPGASPMASGNSFSGSSGGGGGGGGMSSMLPLLAMAAKGGKVVNGEMLAAKGAKVPGQAKVKGDSLKNDNVKALLSPGEIIIPRSVVNSHDPVGEAGRFVAAILAKQSLKGKK